MSLFGFVFVKEKELEALKGKASLAEELESKSNDLRRDLDNANKKIDKAIKELAEMDAKLAEKEEEVSKKNEEIAKKDKELIESGKSLSEASEGFESGKENNKKLMSALKEKTTQWKKEKMRAEMLLNENMEINRENTTLREKLGDSEKRISNLEKIIANMADSGAKPDPAPMETVTPDAPAGMEEAPIEEETRFSGTEIVDAAPEEETRNEVPGKEEKDGADGAVPLDEGAEVKPEENEEAAGVVPEESKEPTEGPAVEEPLPAPNPEGNAQGQKRPRRLKKKKR